MKKLTTAAIIAAGVIASAVGASAANGDFVGYVYSTDILATVDGIPVTSYCLDGKTAVAVRDLEPLGFGVEFYDDARIATVESPRSSLDASAEANVTRGTVGEIVGTIIESDITLYVNGTEVPAYNIGGRLVAAIEDLAPYDPSSSLTAVGYSETELACAWDESTRTIALYTLAGVDNSEQAEQIALDNNLILKIVSGDGRVTFENNAYPEFTDGFTAGIANRYEPLYYTAADGTRTELGYAYITADTVVTQPDGGGYGALRVLSGTCYSLDLAALKTICEANKGIHATIEDELAYWQAGGNGLWKVTAMFETDDYVLLAMRASGLPSGGTYYQTLRLDREPRVTVKISSEPMTGAELYTDTVYGDTLYYISGGNIYKQNVYETEAEFVREATDENIDAYLREYFEVVYEAEDEASHMYILERDGSYRIYYVGTEYGVRSTYLDEVDEIYAYDTRVVYTVDGESKYLISGEEYNVVDSLVDDAAEIREKGTQVV